MKLLDQVALVTGASRGIGKSIALGLAAAGAHVACVATREENAAEVAAAVRALGRRALAVGCRVEDAAQVAAAVERVEAELGPVDLLVNNAGISLPQSLLKMTEENWDQHMDVNAKSVFLCTQAVVRKMQAAGRPGNIVNIGSILGRNAVPATLGYCTSKAAVDHMTRVLAIECAKWNIRVNCVAPGYIRTELIDELVREGKLTLDAIEKRTPQRRMGSGTDVAQAVVYVASADAGFMTGSVLVIDGGWNAYGYF
ncbi:MAG: glucose 1-dehydrogenase [Gammaproteobacteria bacterium]|nr:glucose 1-dehydrogenase [Gammaproteobacteria bacterium]MBI5614658.1 glucose 1-dehydrogenase [Gammaproteobacteria bacterium]